tara:strand:+ start:527 stop:760 length:234 start_codon:yes stop_codon:yes gene_type:complete
MYSIESYNPPKPFWAMSIPELVLYNKKCQHIDKYFLFKSKKTKKNRRTRNRKNRKTKKRRKKTRRILSKSLNLKLKI